MSTAVRGGDKDWVLDWGQEGIRKIELFQVGLGSLVMGLVILSLPHALIDYNSVRERFRGKRVGSKHLQAQRYVTLREEWQGRK
jgi:hypothetical protein